MGYKAFEKGMICRGKQYAENTVYEEKGADNCCEAGVMHYCDEPFAVWDYYPVVDDKGNFTEYAEVEPLDKVLKDGNKRATKKIRIGAKLSLKDVIKAEIDFVFAKADGKNVAKGDYSRAASQGYSSSAASQGDYSSAAIQGNYSSAASQGDYSRAASQGYSSSAASQGNSSSAASHGYCSRAASQGDYSRAASQGDYSRAAIQGDYSRAASQGDYSSAAIQGNYSRAAALGQYSIAAGLGINNKAMSKVGSWIVLAEWKLDDGIYKPICVKSAQIDGETLKPDTWYMLKNSEFTEVADDDE